MREHSVKKESRKEVCKLIDQLSQSPTEADFAYRWDLIRPQLAALTPQRFLPYFEATYITRFHKRTEPWHPFRWCAFGNPTESKTRTNNNLERFNLLLQQLIPAKTLSIVRAVEFLADMLIRSEAIAARSDAGLDETLAKKKEKRARELSLANVYTSFPGRDKKKKTKGMSLFLSLSCVCTHSVIGNTQETTVSASPTIVVAPQAGDLHVIGSFSPFSSIITFIYFYSL